MPETTPQTTPETTEVESSPAVTVLTTPTEYVVGSLKQDTETLSSAVLTNIANPEEGDTYWGVMTVDRGGHYATWDEVKDWQDMAAK